MYDRQMLRRPPEALIVMLLTSLLNCILPTTLANAIPDLPCSKPMQDSPPVWVRLDGCTRSWDMTASIRSLPGAVNPVRAAGVLQERRCSPSLALRWAAMAQALPPGCCFLTSPYIFLVPTMLVHSCTSYLLSLNPQHPRHAVEALSSRLVDSSFSTSSHPNLLASWLAFFATSCGRCIVCFAIRWASALCTLHSVLAPACWTLSDSLLSLGSCSRPGRKHRDFDGVMVRISLSAAISGLIASAAGLDPVEACGNKFFSKDGSQFFIKGPLQPASKCPCPCRC